MRHDLAPEGAAFRLRPVTEADAAFVLELRTDPRLNRWLHPTPPGLQRQLAWLAEYRQRPGDWYFVVEHRASGRPEGLVALYDVDPQATRGEWGRWILRHGSMAAVESAWLIYRVAFDLVGLAEVVCRTVADNRAVVSFHDSCGLGGRRLLPEHFELPDGRHDAVEHHLDRGGWPAVAARLEALARRLAERIR